jgi:hypothetical protein
MKLLKKQQINDRVQTERKNAIDAGVFLARKIDALREELLTLQKTRDDFIAGSQQVINDSLSSLQQKQDSLQKEIKELEVKRKELLIPLDDEWTKVKQNKQELDKAWDEYKVLEENLYERESQIKKTENEISTLAEQTRFNASETEKSKANALALEEIAQRKYEMAETERVEQNENYEKKSKELQGKIETYENGISVNKMKEKDLEKREVALLSEQKHLESQQRTFLLAKEAKK